MLDTYLHTARGFIQLYIQDYKFMYNTAGCASWYYNVSIHMPRTLVKATHTYIQACYVLCTEHTGVSRHWSHCRCYRHLLSCSAPARGSWRAGPHPQAGHVWFSLAQARPAAAAAVSQRTRHSEWEIGTPSIYIQILYERIYINLKQTAIARAQRLFNQSCSHRSG